MMKVTTITSQSQALFDQNCGKTMILLSESVLYQYHRNLTANHSDPDPYQETLNKHLNVKTERIAKDEKNYEKSRKVSESVPLKNQSIIKS